MKKVIVISAVVIGLLIVFLCLSSYTANFSGIMVENGKESNVNITVKNRRINKLLNRIYDGEVCIQLKDNDNMLKFNIMGPAYDLEFYYYVTMMRYDETKNRFDSGNMYFDKGFKNIVIIDSDRKVYAADDEFINIVQDVCNIKE